MTAICVPLFTNTEINVIAASCVNILLASCIEGIKRSISDLYSPKLSKHVSIICLSEMTPRARITINSGIGLRTFGILTTILLFVKVALGDTMRTDVVRLGFDKSSETDRIFTICEYSSFPKLKYNILSANFSWGMITFSFPSMIKYPP